jgi:hypothetical protein
MRGHAERGVIRARGLIAAPAQELGAVVADARSQLMLADGLGIPPGLRTAFTLSWTFEELRAATGVEVQLRLRRGDVPAWAFLLLGGRRRLEARLPLLVDALAEVVRLAPASSACAAR